MRKRARSEPYPCKRQVDPPDECTPRVREVASRLANRLTDIPERRIGLDEPCDRSQEDARDVVPAVLGGIRMGDADLRDGVAAASDRTIKGVAQDGRVPVDAVVAETAGTVRERAATILGDDVRGQPRTTSHCPPGTCRGTNRTTAE